MTLHKLRTTAGLSQAELAKLVGVTQATVSRWEKANHIAHADKLRSLSHALEVTIEDLLNLNRS